MSKANGRPYRGPRSQRDLASGRLDGPRPSQAQPAPRPPHAQGLSISTARPHGSDAPSAPRSPAPGAGHLRGTNRRGILIAAGVVGAAGAGGLVYDRHRRRAAVSKLYDPFSGETVEFGKARYNVTSGTNVRSVTPIVPGGPHVSHENRLSVTTHRRRRRGSPTALEQYRAGSAKQMTGGGKAYGHQARHVSKALSNQQGAAMVGHRGTPMSDVARSGRVGRRLTVA